MWTYLPTWLIHGGQVPELHIGQVLPGVGLRASCWSLRTSTAADGVSDLLVPDSDGDRTAAYSLTGTVDESNPVLLRVDDFQVVAEPNTFRKVIDPISGGYGLVDNSPDFPPDAGTRVSVVCNLAVMRSDEWDDYPDVRRDWHVAGLRIEHRLWDSQPRLSQKVPAKPRIVRVADLERTHSWSDEGDMELFSQYLVDLRVPHQG